jgi:1-acyl-sn-glycerol-3-phosphate acyltransferase
VTEWTYRLVIRAALGVFALHGLRIDVRGAEHLPREGGAVLAGNHVGFLDFLFVGLVGRQRGRFVRFLAKQGVFTPPLVGPAMRAMGHVAVDRAHGEVALRHAVAKARSGEVVGVFPEATISESFTVKELKTGAVRMARSAKVPIIPMAVWGPHRLWTKGHKKELTKRHVPVLIKIGQAVELTKGATPEALTATLRQRLSELLDAVQKAYPEKPSGPDDRWWLPAHLGGTAPLPETAPA